ncbi:VOC family protein [Chloroflexota bacterium]|nr:VOC family protein [Chloroflexota bacterium]
MELGVFSVSLAVQDIEKSRNFYQKLGFDVVGGDPDQKWLILRNRECTIGLFEGMFDKNILTFNPGWDYQAKDLDTFTDIRDLQVELKDAGLNLATEVEPESTGPANIMLLDPDGNPILIDQHR